MVCVKLILEVPMPSVKQLERKISDLMDERDELQDQLDAISDILQEGEEEGEEEEPERGEG